MLLLLRLPAASPTSHAGFVCGGEGSRLKACLEGDTWKNEAELTDSLITFASECRFRMNGILNLRDYF